MCFNGAHNKIDFNISSGVKANMEELEASPNKNLLIQVAGLLSLGV
jgi:hypothetical protein